MARDMVVRISEGVRRQFAQERYLEAEYDRAYSLTSLILFFFSASTVGWLWEVFLHIFMDGALINRGTTWGPWLPIYGVGGVMTLVLLRKFADKRLMCLHLHIWEAVSWNIRQAGHWNSSEV